MDDCNFFIIQMLYRSQIVENYCPQSLSNHCNVSHYNSVPEYPTQYCWDQI